MSSTIGATAYVLVSDPWLFTPSSMNRLLRFVWPFTEGKVKVPIGLAPKPPDEFCETLTVLTPGARASNWVKFRPFNGRSFTSCLTMATPSSELDVSSAASIACTVIVSFIDPAVRLKSKVVVSFTTSVIFVCTEVVNAGLNVGNDVSAHGIRGRRPVEVRAVVVQQDRRIRNHGT